jgi:hypothetical protein
VSKPADLGVDLNRYQPDRLSFAAAVVASVVGWVLVAGGLISTIFALPDLGWRRSLWVAALCILPAPAVWATRTAIASWRIRSAVPGPLLAARRHGRLEVIIDSEQRALRSIAATAYEAASRTDELLADLIALPGVRMFHGIRTAGAELPLIPHAISVGRRLVLIESVAWPPGRYRTAPDGRICCDGTYIGQSVGPFLAAVGQWRRSVPRSHEVSAMIVVHPCADGDISLPAPASGDLAWVRAEDAYHDIRQRLACGRPTVSKYLVAALISATEDHP